MSQIKSFLFICVFLLSKSVFALVEVPPLRSPVTDLSRIFSSTEIEELTQKILVFEKEKGSQIAILVVPSTEPETIEQYAIRVVDQWKLGRKEVDDGVLMLLATRDRKVRIEVGYGLEGALTDAKTKQIIENFMIPHFRSGDYGAGVLAGLEKVSAVIRGEALPELENEKAVSSWLIFLIPLGLIFLGLMLFGPERASSSFLEGGMMGFVVWMMTNLFPLGVGVGVLVFLWSLFFKPKSKSQWFDHSPRSGGGYWGGGGFGGGGGGWSGGGGGFGGGGSSGSW